ncbi:hypothetical protein ACFY7C_07755 [Streptomyces sp. NPDC012769]|uniref:hypothetical protein n=1 Tax=Streptomyces sp. NPDC012769 TaxID=3364848 RepID=UPI0036BE7EA7
MSRGRTKGERRAADRGRRHVARQADAGRVARADASDRRRVLHVVAHPADALTVTRADVQEALADPGRALTVVSLASGGPDAAALLLEALGRGDTWHRRGERLPDGTVLDIHTLSSAPHVEICFVDGDEPRRSDGAAELTGRTVALLERFPATVLRTTDPDPGHVAWDGETATHVDHPEHAAVAQAVLEAVRLRADAPDVTGLVVECFRAGGPCDVPAAPAGAVVRYPGRRIWLTRGADGRLTAYAAVGGGVARWTETEPGGPGWTAEKLPDAPSLLPVLSVAQSPEGWVHLVSLRRTPAKAGGARVEVMHAVQYQTGRPVGQWRSLGSPNGDHPVKSREVGVPCVVVDAEGSPHVFARNFGRGVSSRTQGRNGSWGPWVDRAGAGVTDGLAAVLDEQGRPEVFAPSEGGVIRWHRAPDDAEEDLVRSPHPLPLLPIPGSSLIAQPTGPGRVTVYGSDVRDGALWALRTDGVTTRIGGVGGAGATLARQAIDGYDCTVLLQRAPDGDTAVAAFATDHEPVDVWWERTGGQGVREPAAAVDAFGRLVVASLDPDGRLRVARQDTTVPGLLLGGWVTV